MYQFFINIYSFQRCPYGLRSIKVQN